MSSKVRVAFALALLASCLVLSGCAELYSAELYSEHVANTVGARIEQRTGTWPTQVECASDLAAVNGATTMCNVTLAAGDAQWYVLATVTNVVGGEVTFTTTYGETMNEACGCVIVH